jgi:NAD(P)-dependent dehydrogenase (short-subunit alcohol dehydrogenase family)
MPTVLITGVNRGLGLEFIKQYSAEGWVMTDMGGEGAHITPKVSIAGMRQVIAGLTPADTGRFLTYSGEELPW